MVSVCKRLLFFIINVGAIESSDIEGKIEEPCQVQSLKKILHTSIQEIKGALLFLLLLKPLMVTCKPLVTSMLFLLLGGHRDANSPLSCLQKSIKRPYYSNNIKFFLHSCKETY